MRFGFGIDEGDDEEKEDDFRPSSEGRKIQASGRSEFLFFMVPIYRRKGKKVKVLKEKNPKKVHGCLF